MSRISGTFRIIYPLPIALILELDCTTQVEGATSDKASDNERGEFALAAIAAMGKRNEKKKAEQTGHAI